MTPNSEFRARARAQLGHGIFTEVWMMALLVSLLAGAIISLGSYYFAVVAYMAEGFLAYGLCHVYLSLVRGKATTVQVGDLFLGGNRMGDLILLGLLKNLFISLWSLLFVIPGVVKSYSYAMAYYIKYDHPEYDWKRCIDESRAMMNGHKWRLFCLEFSFIGWWIVGFLCLGVGTLWVAPYQSAAIANFYDDLKMHYDASFYGEEAASADGE